MRLFDFAFTPQTRAVTGNDASLLTVAREMEDVGQKLIDGPHLQNHLDQFHSIVGAELGMVRLHHREVDPHKLEQLSALAQTALLAALGKGDSPSANPAGDDKKALVGEMKQANALAECFDAVAPEIRDQVLRDLLVADKDLSLFLRCLGNSDNQTRLSLQTVQALLQLHESNPAQHPLDGAERSLVVGFTAPDAQEAAETLLHAQPRPVEWI